jgi:sulfotransferase
MIKRVFYNASFPRSGSTLLQNVLGQNPDIYPSPTSGMYTTLLETRKIFTNQILFKAQNQKELQPAFASYFKSAINGYYAGLSDKSYAIDKFRGWLGEYNFVNSYDSNPKIVVMVRDLRSIFASFEKKYRQYPLEDFNLRDYNWPDGNCTPTRTRYLSTQPIMSLPIEGLWETIHQKYDNKIHFIKYEDMCENPNDIMEDLYKYLELPYYQHDFNTILQITKENDQLHGSYADHIIKNKLEIIKEDYMDILGAPACEYITKNFEWFYQYFKYKI